MRHVRSRMCACVHEGGSVRVPGLRPDPKLRPEHRGLQLLGGWRGNRVDKMPTGQS